MPGMLGGRCGSPAISGEPVALSAPVTAQLLEPLASAASPIERRTRVDLLDDRRARRRTRLPG